MGSDRDEIERLKRIRDEQLRARDPRTKQRKIQRRVAAKRRATKATTFGKALAEIPRRWKGLIVGAAIGLVLWIVLPSFIDPPWGEVAGLASVFVLAFFGFLVGRAIDLRDDIRDLIESR
ncbi:MAG: hypothetical protein PVF70_13685 [Anaerolineales bacterium]|jgi:hypothetical protein